MKFREKVPFPLGMLLLISAYLLMLVFPTAVACWSDAILFAAPVPRPAMEGQLSETAQEIPVLYALYRKRILSGGERELEVEETDAGAQVESMAETLGELEHAGVLPPDCREAADEIFRIPTAVAYAGCRDGFIQKTCLGYTRMVEKSISIQQEEKTGLVTACTVSAQGAGEDAAEYLLAYRSYLGLDTLPDWQTVQTESGGAACWSREGQVYLYCTSENDRFAVGAVSMGEESLESVSAALS